MNNCKWICIFLCLIFFKISSLADQSWAVSQQKMEYFIKSCLELPSRAEMELMTRSNFLRTDNSLFNGQVTNSTSFFYNKLYLIAEESFIENHIENQNLDSIQRRPSNFGQGIGFSNSPQINSSNNLKPEVNHLPEYYLNKLQELVWVSVDGFIMKMPTTLELSFLLRLTSHEGSYISLYEDEYSFYGYIDKKTQTLFIERSCLSDICEIRKQQGYSEIFNLDQVVNNAPYCNDIFCATERIFGSDKNIEILYAISTYGLNLSKYADFNADKNGFEVFNINSILLAIQTIPDHLKLQTLNDRAFFRFIRGQTNTGPGVVANAYGSIYDNFEIYDRALQVYTISHEIGHRASVENYYYHAYTQAWLNASGFKEIGDDLTGFFKEYSFSEPRFSISIYGDTNPSEDFAESYNLYRFDPLVLKERSPIRYNYLRENIFNNIEYTVDFCKGSQLIF